MFAVYQLDHPLTDESKILDGQSYFWASLFGPFFILINGFRLLALLMVGISITIFVAAFLVFSLIDRFLGSQLIVLVFALFAVPAAALVAQGIAAVKLVRWGYLRAGWRGGY